MNLQKQPPTNTCAYAFVILARKWIPWWQHFAGLVPVVEAMGEALLYAMFKTPVSSSMPQQFPKGGTTFLFQFQDDIKKDDWRADGYRWRQSGTKKIKGGRYAQYVFQGTPKSYTLLL